jgi:hypothetical protein
MSEYADGANDMRKKIACTLCCLCEEAEAGHSYTSRATLDDTDGRWYHYNDGRVAECHAGHIWEILPDVEESRP